MNKFLLTAVMNINIEMEIAAANPSEALESFSRLSPKDMGIHTGGRESWLDIKEIFQTE